MIDTNQINLVSDNALAIKSQVQANWPAIALGAAWCAREIKNFNTWIESIGERVIASGGLKNIVRQLWKGKAS